VRSGRAVLPIVIGVLVAGQGVARAATPTTVHRAWTQDTGGGKNAASVLIQFAAEVRNPYGGGKPNAGDGGPVGDGGEAPGDGGNSADGGGTPTGDGGNSADGGGTPTGDGGNSAGGRGKPKGDGGKSEGDDGDSVAGNNADPPTSMPTVQNLTRSVATSRAKSVLSRRFGRVFTHGNHKRVACGRQDASSYVCALSWRYHLKRYDGQAIVRRSGVVKTHVVSRRG
jgi:hypothetical protein